MLSCKKHILLSRGKNVIPDILALKLNPKNVNTVDTIGEEFYFRKQGLFDKSNSKFMSKANKLDQGINSLFTYIFLESVIYRKYPLFM